MRALTFLRISIQIAATAVPTDMARNIDACTSDTLVLSDDGGWCWFQHPRALQYGSFLLVGSVAAGSHDEDRCGNIELLIHECSTHFTDRVVLHEHLELDDHDGPALLLRPDNRLLVLYAKHGTEPHFYFRTSLSSEENLRSFSRIDVFAPSPTTELTYANVFRLPGESNRIYNFFRGLDGSYKPSYVYSDDLGQTWHTGNVFLNVPTKEKHRPYLRYASNERDTIHMVYTEGHPRDYDNSLYHIFYHSGHLHQSNGTRLCSLSEGLDSPDQGTRIFHGDSQHVAWVVDLVLDQNERPVCIYSVQCDSAALPVGQGGDDLRFGYARWDGFRWHAYPLAYAGCRLYAGEDDYTGLAAIEPDDVSVVYVATNSDPVTGSPLVSSNDGQRHYELYRGITNDDGQTWSWTALTKDSTVDNLRPIRPRCAGEGSPNLFRALIWLRGKYFSYTNYSQEIVGRVWRVNVRDQQHNEEQ